MTTPATPTTLRTLSPRQREVYDWIRRYIVTNGFSPTLREIGEGLGVSKVNIFEHVGEIEKRGWLTRSKHAARAISLVGVCPGCGRPLEEHAEKPAGDVGLHDEQRSKPA